MNVAAFDLDGTLLVKNSSFAFCTYLYKKKILSFFDFFTCIFFYSIHRYFGASLHWLHRAIFRRLFRGFSVTFLSSEIETFLDENLEKIKYLPAFLRLVAARGNKMVVILSNSPTLIVGAIAKRFNVSNVIATEYTVDDNGTLSDIAKVVDGYVKADFLRSLGDVEKEAYSDSILDLPFLEAATKPIVVRPDKALSLLAKKRGWDFL